MLFSTPSSTRDAVHVFGGNNALLHGIGPDAGQAAYIPGSIDSWNRGSKIPVHRDGPACLHAAVLQKTDFRADPCGCNYKVAGQLFPVFQNQGAYIALGIQAGPGCPG